MFAENRINDPGCMPESIIENQVIELPIPIFVSSETKKLRLVIVGLPDSYPQSNEDINVINSESEIAQHDPAFSRKAENVVKEMDSFVKLLEDLGVSVLRPESLDGKGDSIYTRDIGFVIGDTFFISNMKEATRAGEVAGIKHHVDRFLRTAHIPEGITIEGGDVIVEDWTVYVGTGNRTTADAVEFLRTVLPDHEVVEVPLRHKDVLHLDCCFMPIGDGKSALIYPAGFNKEAVELFGPRDYIPITHDERAELGTNILSIDRETVISRTALSRVNKELRRRGFTVHELSFDAPPALGGSFRCTSLPLLRKD